MNDSPVLWFLIYFVIGIAIVWLIGAFIAWNLLWFVATLGGRLLAVFFVIIVLGSSIKQSLE